MKGTFITVTFFPSLDLINKSKCYPQGASMKQPHLHYEKKHSIPLRLCRVCTHKHSGTGINHQRKFIYTAVPQDSFPQVFPRSTVNDEQNRGWETTRDKTIYSSFPSHTKLDQNSLLWEWWAELQAAAHDITFIIQVIVWIQVIPVLAKGNCSF